MNKISWICEECGSTDISFEGWVRWNYKNQEFILDHVGKFQTVFCDKCGEVNASEISIPEAPPLNQY